MSWACDGNVSALAQDTYQYHGAAFAGAVQTFLAAQCALLTPTQWPADRTEEVLQDPTFDFVVVGAGSAGSVLANRLTEESDWKVLLVEAGGDPTYGTELPGLWAFNLNTPVDWGYEAESQDNACQGVNNKRCYWPRGKVLGGCSSINALYYNRGNADDYNEWEREGNLGWNYESVLPYFKKSENIVGGNIAPDLVSKYHGVGGYLQAEIVGDDSTEDIILQANKEMGVDVTSDFNGASQVGVGRSFVTIQDGRRMSTARAFHTPVKDRSNLYVMKNATVTKILFKNDSNVTNGIQLAKGDQELTINVTKEVILSSGAINTPQLLMLSGIGPKQILNEKGIEIKKELQVGSNLQDHIYVPIFYKMESDQIISLGDYSNSLYNYLTKGDDSFGSIKPNRILRFFNSKNKTDSIPNIEHIFFNIPVNSSDSLDFLGRQHFNDEVTSKFREINKNHFVFVIGVVLLRPESVGRIVLNSTDPFDYPTIYPNYFNQPNDTEVLIEGLKEALKLNETATYREQGITLDWLDLESCKTLEKGSDEFIKCWIKEMSTTLWHPVGTAKMGPANDTEAVVDAELKVHGIEGLQAIDASIMPNIVRGHTNAPVIMIAEKGADMIKTKWLGDNCK